ncbi:hypothetical protein FKM82_004265 [Ascaphus truei]
MDVRRRFGPGRGVKNVWDWGKGPNRWGSPEPTVEDGGGTTWAHLCSTEGPPNGLRRVSSQQSVLHLSLQSGGYGGRKYFPGGMRMRELGMGRVIRRGPTSS